MNIRAYLPSGQFTLIVASIALSAAAVAAAEYFTAPALPPTLSVDASAPASDPSWATALSQIIAQSNTSLPSAPNPQTTQQLLAAAQTGNVTDSVGRSLLVNLASAKSQGLGDDTPTQDSLIAAATAQVQQNEASTTTYTLTNLDIVPATKDSLHTYGNAFIALLGNYPAASEQATLTAVGDAVNNDDPAPLKALPSIGEAYQAMAEQLLVLPVPQTLAPFHLQVVNDYFKIAATFQDMPYLGSDPLRGLVGFQTYESLMEEEGRVFTNIAQELGKDGILFSKDEPGSAWSAFTSPT